MGQHGKHRPLVIPWLAAALALLPGLAQAQVACRLALVLALDISSSVDPAEDVLQRQGLARALLAPEVAEAVFAVPDAPVALAVFEWSGRYQQQVLLDWRMLAAPGDLRAASAAVARSTRSYAEFPTAIGYALGFAAGLLKQAPDCLFRTVDVAGDGVNNDGFPPRLAYAHFPMLDVTVNGLAIGGHDDEVETYYRDHLIRGPGAFVERAAGFEDYERAMRRKLVREMGARILGRLSLAPQPGQ